MEGVTYFFVVNGFKAQNLDDSSKTKFFKTGELIVSKPQTLVTGDKAIITSDGFEIPAENVREVTDQQAIKDLQDMQKRVKEIWSRNFIRDTVRANKYSANGAVWGCMAGMALGLVTKKSLLWCGFVGVVVGGFAGYGVAKVVKK